MDGLDITVHLTDNVVNYIVAYVKSNVAPGPITTHLSVTPYQRRGSGEKLSRAQAGGVALIVLSFLSIVVLSLTVTLLLCIGKVRPNYVSKHCGRLHFGIDKDQCHQNLNRCCNCIAATDYLRLSSHGSNENLTTPKQECT